ncbi:MAG: thermonuclease family protein [Candidatus Nanogingivalis sp.]
MYSFLMLIYSVSVILGIILLPYFIYLKISKKQSKIKLLNYKQRVGFGLIATVLVSAFFMSILPGGKPLFVRDDDQKNSAQKKERETKTPEENPKIESGIVGESLLANEEIRKSPTYKVLRVVDGDTIRIDYNGKDEKVRFIGLDTPETKDPRKPIQCFGREATAKMTEFAENKNVRLEFDRTQGERDKYGRILAFVYSEDNKNLAYEMIRQGYGNEYTYNSNPYKYQSEFKEAARKAREENKGLWAENTCAGDATKPADTPAPKPQPAPAYNPAPAPRSRTAPAPQPQQSQGACVIKGNVGRNGKIYHMPGQKYYNKTNPEAIFCSEAEAQSAGFRRSKV